MSNRLINEQSPYLLQHAHNPVDWYPWCDEAFEKAKQEHKPVIVSIGYAACHWCHVMERESFESNEAAAFMNEHFVCIKVDREEHPDVDHLYMDAVQAISGSGGWPLNVFVTSDRKPFYGGTYYPPKPAFNRPSWTQLMMRIVDIWHNQQDEVQAQATQMISYLQNASKASGKTDVAAVDKEAIATMAEVLLQQADKLHGGFGGAPKFPGSMSISFLLEHYHFTGNEAAKEQALLSLDKMLYGGIYDQIGGGFARYATDDKWLIPHFEKMLYDNALLILSLCDAYAITKEEQYKRIVTETIAFCERELREESGGYYSSLDADSEGVEGKFYTWTIDEWRSLITEPDPAVEAYFGITEAGNWEETNILSVVKSVDEIVQEFGVEKDVFEAHLAAIKKKLLDARSARIRPITDDKSLLSWNALMNMALSRSGRVFADQNYIIRAKEHAQWMMEKFEVHGKMKHVWKNGVARISANLDDHAYLAQALIQLASAAGEPQWLLGAEKICERTQQFFRQEEGVYFYFTSSEDKDLPVRKNDLYDGAMPSANAVQAHNLLLLGWCLDRMEWYEQSTEMLIRLSGTIKRYPSSFGYWSVLLQRLTAGCKWVVCSGDDAVREQRELQEHFIPQAYILTSGKEISEISSLKDKQSEGETIIFVCTRYACLKPVHYANEALPFILAEEK